MLHLELEAKVFTASQKRTREIRGARSVLFAHLVDHMVVATFFDQNLGQQ